MMVENQRKNKVLIVAICSSQQRMCSSRRSQSPTLKKLLVRHDIGSVRHDKGCVLRDEEEDVKCQSLRYIATKTPLAF